MYLHSDTVSMISSNENLIMGLLCLLAVDIPNDLKQAVVIYASPPPPPLHPSPHWQLSFTPRECHIWQWKSSGHDFSLPRRQDDSFYFWLWPRKHHVWFPRPPTTAEITRWTPTIATIIIRSNPVGSNLYVLKKRKLALIHLFTCHTKT